MLQVGVHDADVASSGHAQAGDHRGAQAAGALRPLARQAANARVGAPEREDPLGGVVVAVVDEAEFKRRRAQGVANPLPEWLNVARLVARGHDHAHERGFGGHHRSIGTQRQIALLCCDRQRA